MIQIYNSFCSTYGFDNDREAVKRVYFVDYENVSNAGLDGIDELCAEDKVYIYYTDSHNTITFDTHMGIGLSGGNVFYKYIKLPLKNAIDCKILFDIDKEISIFRRPEIYIISKDSDYDKPIEMVKSQGVQIRKAMSIRDSFSPEIVTKEKTTEEKKLPSKEEEFTNFCKENLKEFSLGEKVKNVVEIALKAKTKCDFHNDLVRYFKDVSKASKVYATLKPLVESLPGK